MYIQHLALENPVIRLAGKEISDTVKILVIAYILFDGMNQREAAVAAGVSLESANKVWREFCNLVTLNGLTPVLESMNLPSAVELAELARDMRRLHITPRHCNQVLPLVIIFRNLKLDPHLIPDLLEAALQLGGKDFPREEYAALIARIRRREKETGLSIEQVDAAHQEVTVKVNALRAESSRLQNTLTGQQNTINNQQNTLTNLRNQSSTLTEEMQAKQRRIDALDARIASEGTTLQELDMYVTDKPYLINLGLDIRKVQSVRSVFSSLEYMGYNPALIINTINQIGNLQTALSHYSSEIAKKQKTVQTLTEAQKTAETEIQNLQEKKKAEESRVDQARQDADCKIAELQQNLNQQMNTAGATEKLLAEYVAKREKLRNWGLEL